MKLTNYMIDLGRIVAFHPNLKRITGSTTASIFLSQLVYWIDKTDDGWIYKDHYDIEEETGLTVYEQQTARKILIELNILEENYKRLDHKIAFRINQEKLNTLWEETSGKMSNPRYMKEEEKPIPINQPVDLRDFQDPALHKNDPVPTTPVSYTAIGKKGDLIDGYMAFANSPGAKKEMIKNAIRDHMESKFHINMANKEWETFIEYVYGRQERHNESAKRFVEWALKKGFDPMYWTPKKCQTIYPMAFVDDQNKPSEDFIKKPPKREEENYAPPPEELKTKKKLY